jgi:Ca-activated chloride channel family protein
MKFCLYFSGALLLYLEPAGAGPVGEEALDKSALAKKQYEEGHYAEALQLYRQALVEAPDTPALNFNAGSALFKTGDLPGAAKEFDQAVQGGDEALKARSFYNLGNTHYQQQQYQQAVEAYKQALELDWQDQDAKANLELALTRQQEQQEQEQSQNQDQQGKQRQEQEQQGQTQQQQQEQQRQAQNQEQKRQDQEQAQRGQQQESQEQKQGRDLRTGQGNRMDREEAEQLLDALREREQEAHHRRQQKTQAYRGKDW